jgi:uncharacterized protein (DUF488 family)
VIPPFVNPPAEIPGLDGDEGVRSAPVGTVFTVGHGTRSADELIEVLGAAGIDQVADVRRFPGSRRHPHFSREQMQEWLPAAGIAYSWRGEELGGRRSRVAGASRHPAWRNAAFQGYADHTESTAYRSAIESLEAESTTIRLAVMCAETLWWRCHRRLIADTLELRGTHVMHLIKPGAEQRHVLHPAVRLDEGGWPVYDVGETPELGLEG